ncbi:Hpt domain-containing protein [Paenibacillus sonchi]|uniref:Hpt domain-containing protein n=1 Tax=Paenibacillus sonchi TaxID=373687 RepID=A0A974PB58_9BACL|nr:Hpt domain-containing protein [Paenibacillus sonchi]QQZ60571.1 Hpt domain-containing protein [Paenibacillus sonchi]
MTTRKYKELVAQRTRQTLHNWSSQEFVSEKDIYRFLHNLKGTAGTVGLVKVEQQAGSIMLYFSEDVHRSWTEAEWGITYTRFWSFWTMSKMKRIRCCRGPVRRGQNRFMAYTTSMRF